MSYGHVVGHLSMAFDDYRNGHYQRALSKNLKPGDHVMDLGAGIGILGFIALAEGAERVVMVEPTTAIEGARIVAKALGLQDRIDFIDKPIEQCRHLPQVDCIVSVFTGNFLLEEDLLPSLINARDTCLKPGGLLLPDQAQMQLTPISTPEFYAKNIDTWLTPSSGVDFSSLRNFAVNNTYSYVFQEHGGDLLGIPVSFFELDFNTAGAVDCAVEFELPIQQSGTCHGLLGSFSARIGDEWLSTEPEAPRTHWSQMFLPLGQPLSVSEGDVLQVSLKRPAFKEWSWVVSHRGKAQTQSTFLGNPVVPADMLKLSDRYQPQLNRQGQLAQQLLSQFDGSTSRDDLKTLATDRGSEELSAREVEQLVDTLIRRFST